MARKYKMVYVNKTIYIGNYMEDGLTINCRKHNIASHLGCMHRAEEFMETDIKLRYRVKGSLQYIIYGKFARIGSRELLQNSKHNLLVVACILSALVFYQNWKKSIKD